MPNPCSTSSILPTHYVFDVHQYLDKDSSGTHAQVVSPTIGSERLRGFTAWCRKHHKRAFLGEFAAAANPAGQAAVDDMISYMEANADVWTGFAWWAAGPWWGDYMYSLEPKDGRDTGRKWTGSCLISRSCAAGSWQQKLLPPVTVLWPV